MESSGIIIVSGVSFKSIFRSAGNGLLWRVLIALFCFPFGIASAQAPDADKAPQEASITDTVLEPMPVIAVADLPQLDHLAAALAASDSRLDTLITLVVVAKLLDYGVAGDSAGIPALEARFLDERAWLKRLASRYTDLPVRGTQLDPAAWFVLGELEQHRITSDAAVSPLGPEHESLMRQLFDRNDERLAASILPEVLHTTEIRAMALWAGLLETAAASETMLAVVSNLYADWFASWISAEASLAEATAEQRKSTPQPDSAEERDIIVSAIERLYALVGSTVLSGPVDERGLEKLRYELLTALPALDAIQARDAVYLLVLATAVDELNEEKYLAFTGSLLWVVTDLLLNEPGPTVISAESELELQAGTEAGVAGLEPGAALEPEPGPEPGSQVPRFLTEILPWLSNMYSGEFSDVDPRLNASLAAVFDAAQYLQAGQQDPDRLVALRRGIGDAVAQMLLQIPEMNYYFDQPVRRRIAEEINICTSIAANKDAQGLARLTREQFDGCLQSLVEMSEVLVGKEELSGDSDGPFGVEQLRRELMMPSWQRINFTLGYLHDRFPTACELPANPLPNSLEWSGLATMITWFARQAPVYFQTPENEALVLRMRQQGMDLLQEMMQQVDCISGHGGGINDPVVRGLADYRLALDNLVAGIREAELEFRADRLKPGADVVLHGDAAQSTAYRTEELVIGPCNPEQVCEMNDELEATRALIGLFPDPYLIADQTGMGSIEICYDNMQWVNRRAEPVRPEDTYVANYFGQLSFDLVGRYREKDELADVFGFNFVSPDESHYLFAAATDEVLADSCPTEWVGSRIVTELSNSKAAFVVPNRLTYLSAIRTRPSEIINLNWSRGSEWRDWFVTGLGVTSYEYVPDETIAGRVNQHLQSIYQAEQSAVYAALLRPQLRNGGNDDETLLVLQEELTARKALVRSYINLFYPSLMVDSDEIRGALEGNGALLDTVVLRRFREANVAVASISDIGQSRLEEFRSDWNRQPDVLRRSGAISSGVAHAIIRLNALYTEFFISPSESAEPMNPVVSSD
ncbi:MAG: hypothetical protein KJO92_05285 [Gammaproteobacteria bacterium]|nr:hypothetical protein [Gammaproteobacteria bacterium]